LGLVSIRLDLPQTSAEKAEIAKSVPWELREPEGTVLVAIYYVDNVFGGRFFLNECNRSPPPPPPQKRRQFVWEPIHHQNGYYFTLKLHNVTFDSAKESRQTFPWRSLLQ
jgi:hypothetical protein